MPEGDLHFWAKIGALTALRWPERELVTVPAAREHYAPARPLTPLEERPDQLLDLDDGDVQELKRLVADRGVVFLRGQEMSCEDQIDFGRRLGEILVFPTQRDDEGNPVGAGHPELLQVHGDADSTAVPGEGWHSDVSCDERPPALSMLRVDTVPSVGGDTVFASMYAAFEALSAPMRSLLAGMTAVHSGLHAGPPYGYFDPKGDYPANEHPVVRTHPVSKRQALYVNSGYTKAIVQLSERESRALLQMLFDHVAYGVQWQCRFSWEANSVAIWDNRTTWHYAMNDYHGHAREMHRITLTGEALAA